MRAYRIHISSWTASFRYPNMISAYQPTLSVPPVSTINGLISAAVGDYFTVCEEKIGYILTYKSKTVDLETIYQMGQSLSQIKSNVVKREFLSEVDLYLYTDSKEISEYFRKPAFQLLLGRSGDLAQVNSIDEIVTEAKNTLSNVKGTVVPFRKHNYLAAPIQALPVSFSNTAPRRNLGTQPYYILDGGDEKLGKNKCWQVNASGFEDRIDEKRHWDVYWQEL